MQVISGCLTWHLSSRLARIRSPPPSLPAPWREVLIQAVDRGLVAVRLGVAVGVGRLGDRRMAELVLRPPEGSASLQEPRGERVAGPPGVSARGGRPCGPPPSC